MDSSESEDVDSEAAERRKNEAEDDYDDDKLLEVAEVKRITLLLNLLSHENPFISEQVSILMANVSNSKYFRHVFITDRCMKALIKILRHDKKNSPTDVSLLAILIAVLNLSSLKQIVRGIENMHFMNSLQDIICNDPLPYVNKSIALLAISNVYTLSKDDPSQKKRLPPIDETKKFAFRVLREWRAIQEGDGENGENVEVVKNLVYSSLILFYNLILKAPGSSKAISEELLELLTSNILDFEDGQIINVVLELVTLFTRE